MRNASLTASNSAAFESANPIAFEKITLTFPEQSLSTPPIPASPGLPLEEPSTLNFNEPIEGFFHIIPTLGTETFGKTLISLGNLTASVIEIIQSNHLALHQDAIQSLIRSVIYLKSNTLSLNTILLRIIQMDQMTAKKVIFHTSLQQFSGGAFCQAKKDTMGSL